VRNAGSAHFADPHSAHLHWLAIKRGLIQRLLEQKIQNFGPGLQGIAIEASLDLVHTLDR